MSSTDLDPRLKTCLSKADVDLLYHNLRRVYLGGGIQEKEAIGGITSHLTQPSASQGDYNGLIKFLAWYGEKFLLDQAWDVLIKSHVQCSRIVELGAGLCWLGRGLAYKCGVAFPLPAVFVDKRQWPMIDVVADIETKNGIERVLDTLKPGDLIVMSELLHCLRKPVDVLRRFSKWPMLIIEHIPPDDHAARDSYFRQIEAFGCKPIGDIRYVLEKLNATYALRFKPPHVIAITRPTK